VDAFSPVARQAALARLRAGDGTPASPEDARRFGQRSRVEGAYPEKEIPAPPRRRAV